MFSGYLELGGDDDQGSILKTIFGGASSEVLLTRWLADEAHDEPDRSQAGTRANSSALDRRRLGLALSRPAPRQRRRRAKTVRFVLVNEFRRDLRATPPASIGDDRIAGFEASSSSRVREVADALRRGRARRSIRRARRSSRERASTCGRESMPPVLGATDTFRFEERLLRRAIELDRSADEYEEAIALRSTARGAIGSIGTWYASSSGKHANLRPSWVARWLISRSR